MAQRGLVVYSQAALERAEATLNNARPREDEAIHKPLLHLQAQRFATPEAAQEALTALAKGWTYHQVDSYHLSCPSTLGAQRPPDTEHAGQSYRMAHPGPRPACMRRPLGTRSNPTPVVVIGTNIGASEWRDPEVIAAYKRQSRVEGGFRFLKDPLVFVSSLFVTKALPSSTGS